MYTSFLYKYAPVVIQNILISVRGISRKLIREKRGDDVLLKEVSEHCFDKSRVSRFAANQLSHVLKGAVNTVPFYQNLNLVGKVELEDFTYISKKTLINNAEKFNSQASKGFVIYGATSGTTGLALNIPQNLNSVLREQVFVSRYLNWAGYTKGDKRAWIRGDMIIPITSKTAPFWRYSYFEDMILLSSFHLLTSTMPLYLNAMYDFDVDIIQAYPSSIVALAKYLEVTDSYYLGTLKSIITSSETLSSEDKALVEKRFKCTVFDWYGLFERVAAIGSCEHGRYHIFTDYSHVELLPAGDTIDGQSRAEIVGTNFNNSHYPLIRYKTGDHVILSNETHCPCGRVFPIVESIEGRASDYLIGEDGQKVMIINHIPKGIKGVLGCQFFQRTKHEIEVRVLVNTTVFDSKEQKKLIQNTNEKLGYSISVSVKIVSQLERTKAGKVRQVICDVEDFE